MWQSSRISYAASLCMCEASSARIAVISFPACLRNGFSFLKNSVRERSNIKKKGGGREL